MSSKADSDSIGRKPLWLAVLAGIGAGTATGVLIARLVRVDFSGEAAQAQMVLERIMRAADRLRR